jgi:hypothetical protein
MATDAQVIAATQFGWTWLKAHERLIMLALVLAVGTFGLSKYFDVEAARKDAKYVAAEQIVANDQKNSAALALQSSQTQAQYIALVQALSAQNASLSASIAQRTASGVVQRTTDASLPVAGVAARWNDIAGTLVTASGDTIVVSRTDAHKTLDMIEQVPVLVQNLADETKIAGNYQSEAQKADLLAGDLHSQVTGLNTQLADQTKACTAQVAAVKAEGRKSKIKFFKWGFITGFISGMYLGHAAGL